MSRAARAIDLPIRIGVHTGDVELLGDDIRGLAVHAAARVMSLGGAEDVMSRPRPTRSSRAPT